MASSSSINPSPNNTHRLQLFNGVNVLDGEFILLVIMTRSRFLRKIARYKYTYINARSESAKILTKASELTFAKLSLGCIVVLNLRVRRARDEQGRILKQRVHL